MSCSCCCGTFPRHATGRKSSSTMLSTPAVITVPAFTAAHSCSRNNCHTSLRWIHRRRSNGHVSVCTLSAIRSSALECSGSACELHVEYSFSHYVVWLGKDLYLNRLSCRLVLSCFPFQSTAAWQVKAKKKRKIRTMESTIRVSNAAFAALWFSLVNVRVLFP